MYRKYFVWAWILIFQIIAAAASGLTMSRAATLVSTRTPFPTRTPYYRRTPTPTRTPYYRVTLTPTRTPILAKLRSRLVWGGLGGGESEDVCEPLLPRNRRDLPKIISAGRLPVHQLNPDGLQNMGAVCIFGLPFDKGIVLEISNPSGQMVDKVTYQLGTYNKTDEYWKLTPVDRRKGLMEQEASIVDNVEVIYIKMWWPEGLVIGRWKLVAQTNYGSVSGQFTIPPPHDKPVVNVGQPPKWVFPKASPLETPGEEYLSGGTSIETRKYNDRISIFGENFVPDSTTLIGLYANDYFYNGPVDGQGILIAQGSAQADRRGEWEISYLIKPSDPAGEYFLIVVLRPDKETLYFSGPYVHYMITQWQACEDTYLSRLTAGIRAKVNEQPPLANLVRKQASRNASIIGRIQPGEEFEILDGPRCNDNWVWWYIESEDGLRGWTAEGDAKEYWLSPLW